MGALAAVLVWVGRFLATAVVGRILLAFGVYFVSQKFLVDPLLAYLRGLVIANTGGDFAWIIGALNLDRAITIILSAIAIRQASRSLSARLRS